MKFFEHDLYSIADAARILECEIEEIVMMGSEGKLELQVFFNGHIERGLIEYTETEGSLKEPYPIPEESYQIEGFMSVCPHDLQKLYVKNASASRRDIAIEISDFKNIEDKYFKIVSKGYGRGLTPSSIEIGYGDLFVKGRDLNLLQEVTMDTLPLYLDPEHEFHAPELRIAVEAWQALYSQGAPNLPPSGGNTAYIKKWLGNNYPHIADNAKERIVRVVNPNKKGGASRTPGNS